MNKTEKKDLLLVVDMQNVYRKGGKWQCTNTDGAASNIIRIIDSQKADVIFTEFIACEKAAGVWADYNIKYADVNSDREANLINPLLAAYAKKYPLYKKGVYSSLSVPEVLSEAKKHERVVITGVVAECCVLSTVFALIDAGIYTVYLTDAVSGLDEPKEKATELILSGLSPLHLKMCTTAEYLSE